MKIITISLMLLILSISISCEKKEEEPTLSQNLQNGFWESGIGLVMKFNGTIATSYYICTGGGCSPNPPCLQYTSEGKYTIGGNTITLDPDGTFQIKIEGDVLTIEDENLGVFQRKQTLDYTDC